MSNSGHGMKPLSAPAEAYGINDSGQIAGHCFDVVFVNSYACTVSNGAITALPESDPNIGCSQITTIPGAIPEAVAINNNGQIVANATASGNPYQEHALLLNP